MKVKDVAVVGAGQMGAGIAQVLAVGAADRVLLYDLEKRLVETAIGGIGKSLEKLEKKDRLNGGRAADILKRVVVAERLEDVAGCAFVVEAVVERLTVKQELFAKLAELTGDAAVLASNTSSIPIALLGQATPCPERVIGMHFMNPVPLMPLVEVIRGPLTDDATFDKTVTLVEAVGKQTVSSRDFPGFIVNRILMPMINEAFFALQENLASAEDIDKAMRLGTNQPMGPLTLADFIGLDTCLFILEVMHKDLGDPKFRPSPLLRQLVNAGLYGRKCGRGVFKYES